jgi:hypothetical protein
VERRRQRQMCIRDSVSTGAPTVWKATFQKRSTSL